MTNKLKRLIKRAITLCGDTGEDCILDMQDIYLEAAQEAAQEALIKKIESVLEYLDELDPKDKKFGHIPIKRRRRKYFAKAVQELPEELDRNGE